MPERRLPIEIRLRDKKPAPEVVAAFEEACGAELRTPGKVIEALMIQWTQMQPEERARLAELRAVHLGLVPPPDP